jgi:hypothetical protein
MENPSIQNLMYANSMFTPGQRLLLAPHLFALVGIFKETSLLQTRSASVKPIFCPTPENVKSVERGFAQVLERFTPVYGISVSSPRHECLLLNLPG